MKTPPNASYAGKLKTQLYWWLTKKTFVINDEYSIELIHIDRNYDSVKILITNLKNKTSEEHEVSNDK